MPIRVLFGAGRFLFERGNVSRVVQRDDPIFFCFAKISDVVNAKNRFVLFARESSEILEALGKEIVSRHHQSGRNC
jgi:hypothetical protein